MPKRAAKIKTSDHPSNHPGFLVVARERAIHDNSIPGDWGGWGSCVPSGSTNGRGDGGTAAGRRERDGDAGNVLGVAGAGRRRGGFVAAGRERDRAGAQARQHHADVERSWRLTWETPWLQVDVVKSRSREARASAGLGVAEGNREANHDVPTRVVDEQAIAAQVIAVASC